VEPSFGTNDLLGRCMVSPATDSVSCKAWLFGGTEVRHSLSTSVAARVTDCGTNRVRGTRTLLVADFGSAGQRTSGTNVIGSCGARHVRARVGPGADRIYRGELHVGPPGLRMSRQPPEPRARSPRDDTQLSAQAVDDGGELQTS